MNKRLENPKVKRFKRRFILGSFVFFPIFMLIGLVRKLYPEVSDFEVFAGGLLVAIICGPLIFWIERRANRGK